MQETMLAARFMGPGQELELQQVGVPRPGPLEVLVKVEACGICTSDVHLLDGSFPPVELPVTPGHEAFGTVVQKGELAEGWAQGDRVVLAGGRNCGTCQRCRSGRFEECLAPQIMGFSYDGAWAEYVLAPFYMLSSVPEGIVAEQAAILADAVATPFAALVDRGALRPGESVGLWGIGGLGTHAVQLARLLGASPVVAVDPLEGARRRALACGADVALDPSDPDLSGQVMQATGGLGLDLALDLVGANAALQQAESVLGRGGRLVIVGLSLEPIQLGPSFLFAVQSHALMGHLGYQKRHLDELVRLLATRRLDLSGSVTDVVPLADVAEGVRRLSMKEGDPVRIVVRP